MTDGMGNLAGAIGTGLGLAIGVGFGVATLRMLGALPPRERSEVGKLLNYSRKVHDNLYEVQVRNHRVSNAKKLLNRAGFEITDSSPLTTGITMIIFKEKKE